MFRPLGHRLEWTEMSSFALGSSRVLVDGDLRPADVVIAGGRIAEIRARGAAPAAEDLGDAALLPGLVDAHVHVNDPGTDWEGWDSATRAAAASGVTLVCDMPLNSDPVTTTAEAFDAKAGAARGRLVVDAGLYGGVVPGNATPERLAPLLDRGVLAIKAFLCDSGLPAFPAVTVEELRRVAPLLARRRVPLLVHAEMVDGAAPAPAGRRYADYLRSRPPRFELRAIEALIGLCRESGCAVHVVHLAAAEALPMLRAARGEGLPVAVETCPHYLTFCAEEIPDGATLWKCAPPIRGRANREGLWQGLREGTIDLIASDHSPCPPARKAFDTGDFAAAWGGISSLQLLLPAVWTEASARGFSIDEVVRWLGTAPRALLGLGGAGGGAAPGLVAGVSADLLVDHPEREFVVAAPDLEHRHPLTPYQGRRLRGSVRRTYLRGQGVFERERWPAAAHGRLVVRAGPGAAA